MNGFHLLFGFTFTRTDLFVTLSHISHDGPGDTTYGKQFLTLSWLSLLDEHTNEFIS